MKWIRLFELLIACILVALVVFAIIRTYDLYSICNASGGKLVQGVIDWECVK